MDQTTTNQPTKKDMLRSGVFLFVVDVGAGINVFVLVDFSLASHQHGSRLVNHHHARPTSTTENQLRSSAAPLLAPAVAMCTTEIMTTTQLEVLQNQLARLQTEKIALETRLQEQVVEHASIDEVNKEFPDDAMYRGEQVTRQYIGVVLSIERRMIVSLCGDAVP